MTNEINMTPEQIRIHGLEVLSRELGPAGMVQFIQQFDSGHGDYTQERRQWLDFPDVKSVAEKIEQKYSPRN